MHTLYQAGEPLPEIQKRMGHVEDDVKAKRCATLLVRAGICKSHVQATASALREHIEGQPTIDHALVAQLQAIEISAIEGKNQVRSIRGFLNTQTWEIFDKSSQKSQWKADSQIHATAPQPNPAANHPQVHAAAPPRNAAINDTQAHIAAPPTNAAAVNHPQVCVVAPAPTAATNNVQINMAAQQPHAPNIP